MTPSRALAAALAIVLAAAPATARADVGPPPAPSAEAVAQARQHFTRGVKLYEEDDFRTALIEFNRAYELAPNWQVLYNMGQAYYQLRDYANALATMEKYVAAGGASIAKDRRQQVDREMEELRGRVAHVTFTANTEGAEVTLDDVSLGRTPFGAPLVVGAGRHRVVASKAGWASAVKMVDVAGGEPLTIALELSEQTRATAAVTTAPRGEPSYAPALVVGGVGVAGLAVGTVFGVMALGNKATLDSECTAAKTCPHGTGGDIDAFHRNGAISTAGFVVGAVGLGLGAVLYFNARAGESREAQAGMRVWMAPGGAGVGGTF